MRYALALSALAAVPLAAVVTFAVLGPSVVSTNSDTVGVVRSFSPPVSTLAPLATRPVPAAPVASATAVVVLLWAAGVAGQAAWHLAGWTRVRRLGLEPPTTDARWTAALADAARRLGVDRPVRLLGELPPEHDAALLAHELAHIRRHDDLVNLIQCAVESVLFYHPAVWWMSGVVRREREHCCDDLAATVAGRAETAVALVAVERCRATRLAPSAAGSGLTGRVRRLTGSAPAGGRGGPAAGLLVAAITVAAVTGWQVRTRTADGQSHPTTRPDVGAAALPPVRRPDASAGPVPDRPGFDPEVQVLVERRKLYAEQLRRHLEQGETPYLASVASLQEEIQKLDTAIQVRTQGRPWVAADAADRFNGEVYVGGDVARAGVYAIHGEQHTTASQMVIAAGDVNVETGQRAWVTIIRRSGDRSVKAVDGAAFGSLLDGSVPDPDLQAGDVVRVSRLPPIRNVFTISGDVKRPAEYPLAAGQKVTIRDAIRLSGGTVDGSDRRFTWSSWDGPGRQTSTNFNSLRTAESWDTPLKAGDEISVSSK